ncbi:hypothetical protein WA026_000927, partial [Henosepilachna vigintioctopunctata]
NVPVASCTQRPSLGLMFHGQLNYGRPYSSSGKPEESQFYETPSPRRRFRQKSRKIADPPFDELCSPFSLSATGIWSSKLIKSSINHPALVVAGGIKNSAIILALV